ncbi:MAG: hypothetical protein NZ740_01010 [Kiritimatiellae bacterium]|nr:hypothetical protein [Kiritimatiellia bacterium]MDW8457670.1 hypothetical protein [Verrucomicrobiota bacterium]
MTCKPWMVYAAVALLAAGPAFSISLTHEPVPFAVRGQPLTLRAKVEGGREPHTVTLYYQLFKDAAPFRVAMKSSGLGYFVGAIEANLLTGVESVSYYIEAQDADGQVAETEWYTVKIREPRPSDRTASIVPPPAPAPAGPAPEIPVSEADKSPSWRTPALIAGGAAVVLGGAYLISRSGDDGDGGGDPSTNAPGSYAGTVVLCSTPPSAPTTCQTDPYSLLIDSRNVVFSDTIRPGQSLTSPLVNNRFTFTANVPGGSIVYNGTWANGTIVGQISGSATSAAGTVVYSGTFSANKL